MFEVQRAWNLKNAGDGRIFTEGEAGDEGWADVVSVDEVGADVGDELAAGTKRRWNAPRLARGEIQVGSDDGGAGLAIFGGEAFGVGGERDDYFDAEGAEDADLFVGPVGADGGFDDVQNLHRGDHSNPERRARWGKYENGLRRAILMDKRRKRW